MLGCVPRRRAKHADARDHGSGEAWELAAREEEARAFAQIHEQRMAVERARVQQELARRNASERPDEECPICFEAISNARMRASMPCNAKHWVCKECRALNVFNAYARQHSCFRCSAPLPMRYAVPPGAVRN